MEKETKLKSIAHVVGFGTVALALLSGCNSSSTEAPQPVDASAPAANESFAAEAQKPSGVPTVVNAESEAMTPEAVKTAIESFMAKYNLEVVEVFPLYKGLYPVIVSQDRKASVIYFSPEGESGVIIAGDVFDLESQESLNPEGVQTALQTVQDELAKVDFAALMPDIEAASTLVMDNGGPEIYMFYEPHCGYCMLNQAELVKKQVKVRYVPVTFLTEESLAIAGLMLNTPPEKARELMSNISQRGSQKKWATEGSQYASDPAVRTAVEHNNRLMRSMGIGGTPAFFFKNPDGSWGTHNGVLQGQPLDALLAKLSG